MQDINRLKLLLAEKYKIGTWLSEEMGRKQEQFRVG